MLLVSMEIEKLLEIDMKETGVTISNTLTINVKRDNEEIKLPHHATPGSSGFDIFTPYDVVLPPGEVTRIDTGLRFEIPHGWEIQCRSKSGLASKSIIVANSPGTIDSDYRGECSVLLANLAKEPYHLYCGNKIAQLVVARVHDVSFSEVEFISTDTVRGSSGFGSTGA